MDAPAVKRRTEINVPQRSAHFHFDGAARFLALYMRSGLPRLQLVGSLTFPRLTFFKVYFYSCANCRQCRSSFRLGAAYFGDAATDSGIAALINAATPLEALRFSGR